MKESNNRKFFIISHTITILFLIQVILSLLFYNWAGIDSLTYVGWIIIIIGSIIFYKALVDLRIIKNVDNGNIVNKGMFSIIRHLMYLSFIFIAIGLIFISQYSW